MPLVVVSKLIAAGQGLAPALLRRASVVALDWDTRRKSRFEAIDSAGRRLAVFLPRGRVVRGGDVLVGEDGSLVRVEAMAQPVLVVTAAEGADAASGALALARAAYHLGNRHVPLEVRADRLVLERDHVLAELLARLGLEVATTNGPFEPEPGAYDAAATARASHGHEHGHGHDHAHDGPYDHHDDHDHDHGHGHGLDRGHGRGQTHGHANGHEHAHGHEHEPSCDYIPDASHPSGPHRHKRDEGAS